MCCVRNKQPTSYKPAPASRLRSTLRVSGCRRKAPGSPAWAPSRCFLALAPLFGVEDSGFGICGLSQTLNPQPASRFRVEGLGVGAYGLGLQTHPKNLGLSVLRSAWAPLRCFLALAPLRGCLGFGIWDPGVGMWGVRFQISYRRVRVWGLWVRAANTPSPFRAEGYQARMGTIALLFGAGSTARSGEVNSSTNPSTYPSLLLTSRKS